MSVRPENERPELVPLVCDLLFRDDSAAWITSIQAYSMSFEFDLAIRKRSSAGGNIDSFGFGRPSAEGLVNHVLFGMEFADGYKMSNVSTSKSGGLKVLSGSGGPQSSVTRFLCPRLPSPGVTTFYIAWPSLGISESSCRLDTSPIREASLKSRILWRTHETTLSTVKQDHSAAMKTDPERIGWFDDL